MNIPIYRAKRLMDGDEYVEGYLLPSLISKAMHRILVDNRSVYFIDDSTLAIHFPDMLDGQGNKFFASLSKNGKGGDKFITENKDEQYDIWKSTDYGTTTAIFNSSGISFTGWRIEEDENNSIYSREHTRIIGVQE